MAVDPRAGSGFFVAPLRSMGLPVEARPLSFADFAFTGQGPSGKVRVGVERKTVSEILTAITDTRFTGHQLPGLLTHYDYTWIVVEGYARVDPASGILMSGKRAAGFGGAHHLYATYQKFLITLAARGGVRVQRCLNRDDTAWFLFSLYGWWQKPWAAHKSIAHVPETPVEGVFFEKPSVKRRALNQLPGLDWERTRKVCAYFPTLAAAVNATEAEWQKALGLKAGRKMAARLHAVCHEASR